MFKSKAEKAYNKVYDGVIDELIKSIILLTTIRDRQLDIDNKLLNTSEIKLREEFGQVNEEFKKVEQEFMAAGQMANAKKEKIDEGAFNRYTEIKTKREKLNNELELIVKANEIAAKNARNLEEQLFHLANVVNKKSLLKDKIISQML